MLLCMRCINIDGATYLHVTGDVVCGGLAYRPAPNAAARAVLSANEARHIRAAEGRLALAKDLCGKPRVPYNPPSDYRGSVRAYRDVIRYLIESGYTRSGPYVFAYPPQDEPHRSALKSANEKRRLRAAAERLALCAKLQRMPSFMYDPPVAFRGNVRAYRDVVKFLLDSGEYTRSGDACLRAVPV